MQAIFFALISFVGWGVGDIFGTIAARRIGGYSTAFWYLLFQVPLYSVLAPFFLDNLKNLTWSLLILNLVLGIIGTIGLIAFYEGLRRGNPSLVGTISGAFAALTVILSTVFLGEIITINQGLAIIVIFIGLTLSNLDFKQIRSGKIKNNAGVLMAITAMICWGIYFAFMKIPIKEIGWFWPGVISLSSLIVIPLFMRLMKIKLERVNTHGAFLSVLANAVLLGIGTISVYYAIEIGLTSIVAPIAGSYPALFVFLAFLIFKEPITRQQILGIITTLTGVVFLSIFSV